MTRSELISALAIHHPDLNHSDVSSCVTTLLDSISEALSRGRRAEIRDFGTFAVNWHPPRKARNPKTGEVLFVPAKVVPHFRAGKELRERVNF
jgi:integration host factor subunit beta